MDAEEPAMRLMVRWRNALMHEDVARVLVGLCGASAEITSITADGDVEMIVDAADVEPADFELAAQQLAAGRDFFIPRTAQWSGGLLGVMQLMTVVELSRGLHYSPVPGIRL